MAYTQTNEVTNTVEIEMADGGKIVVELDEKSAPITVKNFQKLVSQHFYDGLIFHRVISGFMIQGGDPQGTGMGGSKETIKGEFRINGVANPVSHERGVISMARSQFYNSASSQFFICHADAKFLDGQYAAFGKVVEGMDVVDRIADTPTNRDDRPLCEQKNEASALCQSQLILMQSKPNVSRAKNRSAFRLAKRIFVKI